MNAHCADTPPRYSRQRSQQGAAIAEPDWVDSSVVSWFRDTSDKLSTTYGTSLPSLAFVHIPIHASAAFQSAAVNSSTAPGINVDGAFPGQGQHDQDAPFMQALLATKNLTAVFSGHQHGDDWCFKWSKQLSGMKLTGNGIDLCFGRRSGYGGYGDWKRGSRQVLLILDSLGSSIETWTRLEDGNVSGEVTLNSTFGTDRYPLVQY